jgi:enoyl-CoA hydratase
MTLSDNGSPVTWHAEGGVLEIVLDRPPANALGLPIVEGLHAGLNAAKRLPAKVIVVSSALPGFFAAGADIKHMSSIDAESFGAYGDALRGAVERLAAHPAVSVAAVDGLALGGGLEVAMACSLRVAGSSARLGLPEVKLGLIPGAGGTQRLPHLVGRGRALDIMLTGREVDAEEALRIGLVDRLVPAGTALTAARELARELCAASSPAQRAVVRTVNAAYDRQLAEGLRYEAEQVNEVFERGEAAEGIRAFLDKRAPEFV